MPKQYGVEIKTEIESAVSLGAEGRKAGKSRKKGWFQRVLVGTLPQRGRPGAFALVNKFMKRVRFGNWYSEKVIDKKTGEVIHQCEEPLSEHQKHGSAKRIDSKGNQ